LFSNNAFFLTEIGYFWIFCFVHRKKAQNMKKKRNQTKLLLTTETPCSLILLKSQCRQILLSTTVKGTEFETQKKTNTLKENDCKI